MALKLEFFLLEFHLGNSGALPSLPDQQSGVGACVLLVPVSARRVNYYRCCCGSSPTWRLWDLPSSLQINPKDYFSAIFMNGKLSIFGVGGEVIFHIVIFACLWLKYYIKNKDKLRLHTEPTHGFQIQSKIYMLQLSIK